MGQVLHGGTRMALYEAAHCRLRARLATDHAGEISFAVLGAAIQGWIAHVAHADSWGLRRPVLDTLVMRLAEHRRAVSARPTRHG